MTKGSQARKIGPAILICLISVLLCCTIFELVLRFGLIRNPRYDHLTIQGRKDDAKYKLLILGDSFIERHSSLARALTKDLESSNITILNAAVSGTGPYEYLEEMKAVGVKFKPHVVLLSYYIGNDLTDVQYHPNFTSRNREASIRGIAINSNSNRRFIGNFYLYHYLLKATRSVRLKFFDYRLLEEAGIPSDLIEESKQHIVNPWLLKQSIYNKNYILDNLLIETEENMNAWRQVTSLLEEIHDICTRYHAQFIMVIFPHTLQINDSHIQFLRKLRFNIDVRALESVKPQTSLMDFCIARKIPCLDLLPEFKTRKMEEFYREKDDHLNDNGNRLAEELILQFLREHSLIGS